MIVTDFVTNVWIKSNGELPTFTEGTDEWNYIVALGNYFITQWANEPGATWNSLYNPAYSIGTVTATDRFDYDKEEVRTFSQELGDTVRIIKTDGVSYTDYDLVSADDLKNNLYDNVNTNVCAAINGQLVFPLPFNSGSSELGGTIYAPVYLYPDTIANAGDDIPIDNPNWLVAIVAADIARNDILRKDQYTILVKEANSIMDSMKEQNGGQLIRMGTPWMPFSGNGGYTGNYNGYGQ